MPYLVLKNSLGQMLNQWDLRAGTMVFGRADNVDVKLDDPHVSRLHFQVEARGDAFFLRDLGSANGTYHNGTQLMGEVELRPEDRIRAGQSSFLFTKGLGTIIGELADSGKGYQTALKEISQETKPRPKS